MRVSGPTGDDLSLGIGGWRFPSIEYDQYDSNWLLIDVSATVRGRSWTTRDPCLLTWEVADLIAWLDSLATGGQVEQELDFMEPNLSDTPDHSNQDRIFPPEYHLAGHNWLTASQRIH